MDIDSSAEPESRGEMAASARNQLRRPSAENWDQLRPWITTCYNAKHYTAAMIETELRKKGYHVTVKMLRDRFKQWHIDTKNRRVNGRTQTPVVRVSQQLTEIEPQTISSVVLIARPVTTNVQDTEQRRLLCAVSHWYDEAWSRANKQATISSWVSVVLNKATDAAFVATRDSNHLPWNVLWETGTELKQIPWLDLSPHRLIKLLRFFVHWQLSERPADEMNIFPLLRLLLNGILVETAGPEYPLVLLLEAAIRQNLTIELCRHVLALDFAKASELAASPSQRQKAIVDSRLEVADMLYRFREFKMVNDLLNPCQAFIDQEGAPDPFQLWNLLGMSKFRQGEYEEAEKLLSRASNSNRSENVSNGFRIAENHAHVLRRQGRMADVAKVVTEALLKYEPGLEMAQDNQDAIVAFRCLECRVTEWWVKAEHCQELEAVVERLSAVKPG